MFEPTTNWRVRAQRGTVLIIVLGVLTILAVMGTAFARFMRTELQASKFFELRKKAEQLAHDGITIATSKLANVAGERHFTTLKDANWTFETDIVTGRQNYVAGSPATGYGYTRLEDSTDVSFALPAAGLPAGITPGTCSFFRPGTESTLAEDGDRIRLKVLECQGLVNVRWLSNAPFAVFRDTLWDLGVAISRANNADWFGANPFLQDADNVVNGEQVIAALWAAIDPNAQNSPPDNQSYAPQEYYSKEHFLDTLRNIHRNLNMPDDLWELAQDFITCTSWPVIDAYSTQTNQVWEVRDPDGNGDDEDYYWLRDGVQNDANFHGNKEMYNLTGVAMPPINVNTAPREVLMVLFNRIQGEREYSDVQGMTWANDFGMPDVFRMDASNRGQYIDAGQHRGQALGAFANDSVMKFIQIGPFQPARGTPMAHTLDILVDIVMREREHRPFTSWHDFDMRVITRLDEPQNGGFPDQQFGMPEGLAALPSPQTPFDNGSLGLIGLITGGNLKAQAFTQPDWETYWYESCRELLRAALQPAPKVVKYNPDEAYWQASDALDVQFRFAPVCFHSYGIYEITSLAEINGPVYDPQLADYTLKPASSAKVRAVVKVMDIMRHHSQEDFCTGMRVNGTDPSDETPAGTSITQLTTNATITFPNFVDESAPIGLNHFRISGSPNHWNRRGPGPVIVQPNPHFGYVQIRPADHSPHQLIYHSVPSGWWVRLGGATGSNFIHKYNARGIDPNHTFGTTWSPNHQRDYAIGPRELGIQRRARTANNNDPDPQGRTGVQAHTDSMPDGILLTGRGRDRDDPQYGRQWAPRYWRYPIADLNPTRPYRDANARQIRGNVPYYRGTVEFWVKFRDDWWGTTNSLRANSLADKNIGNRANAQRNAFHADNYFCGLFGATSFSKRDNDHIVGQQMFIYKDVGMQLKIVRLLFAQAFTANINRNTGAIQGSINDLGDIEDELDAGDWDLFPRDDAKVAQQPNDLGPLFARMDCIVFLDALPFPILPHHWYHLSVSWDSNDDPDNPRPTGEYQSSPYSVCINGYQARYAVELVVPDAMLTAGINDGHEYEVNGEPFKAHAAVILNELNPEDRMTVGCVERLMLPHSHYQALGKNPTLFQFANHDPANDPDRPFRLVAPANATIDNLRIAARTVRNNYYNYANGEPLSPPWGNAFRYARYVQPVYHRHNWSETSALRNRLCDPRFPNANMADANGYYYENGFVNTYSVPVRPAWIAWTEYRPRWDPTRHLGPLQPNNVPHGTLGGAPGVLGGGGAGNTPKISGYEPPRSNIGPWEADYVHIFAGVGRRALNAWNTIRGGTKLNSEAYHTTTEFSNDPYKTGALAAPSMRQDRRNFDLNKNIYVGGTPEDNLTWYGGMSWPKQAAGADLVVNPNETVLYRAYFRRGEATIDRPHMTTPILDEVVVGLVTPPRFIEYTVLD